MCGGGRGVVGGVVRGAGSSMWPRASERQLSIVSGCTLNSPRLPGPPGKGRVGVGQGGVGVWESGGGGEDKGDKGYM